MLNASVYVWLKGQRSTVSSSSGSRQKSGRLVADTTM